MVTKEQKRIYNQKYLEKKKREEEKKNENIEIKNEKMEKINKKDEFPRIEIEKVVESSKSSYNSDDTIIEHKNIKSDSKHLIIEEESDEESDDEEKIQMTEEEFEKMIKDEVESRLQNMQPHEEGFFMKTGKQIGGQVAQASAMMLLPVVLKYLFLRLGNCSAPIGTTQRPPMRTNMNSSNQEQPAHIPSVDIPHGNF